MTGIESRSKKCCESFAMRSNTENAWSAYCKRRPLRNEPTESASHSPPRRIKQSMLRTDRRPDELRPLSFQRGYTGQAPGSVLVKPGRTTVLCTCCVENAVPPFLEGTGQGWPTPEYGMLPGSTGTRRPPDKGGKVHGRAGE